MIECDSKNRKGGTINIPPVAKLKKSPPTVNCGGGVLDCLLLFQIKKGHSIYTESNIQIFSIWSTKKTAKDYFTSSDAAEKRGPIVSRANWLHLKYTFFFNNWANQQTNWSIPTILKNNKKSVYLHQFIETWPPDLSTGHIGNMPIGYMVCECIGKEEPPMISRTIFSYYSLSIYWWMKDGDRLIYLDYQLHRL